MRDADPHEARGLQRLANVLALLSALGGIVGLGAVLFIALAHLHDTYAVDHVAGSWLALARAADHGTLYPALHTATTWGGTRYVPLQFVLNAGAALVTGEYVTSGKILALLAAIALIALIYVSLRGERVRPKLALGACAVVAVAPLGLLATTSIHGDTLPVVFQFGALLLVLRGSRRGVAVAGALCALAFLTKLSAVWAPIAIGVWLWRRQADRLLLFIGALVSSSTIGLTLFMIWSHGRLASNVLGLSFSGSGGLRALVLDAPQRVVSLLTLDGLSIFALVPICLLVLGIQVARRELTLWSLSFICSLGVLLVVQTDVGTSSNHLLDLSALIVVNAGALIGEGEQARLRSIAEAAFGCAIVWGVFVGVALTAVPAAKVAAKGLLGREPGVFAARPASAYLPSGATILSEDPTIPVVRGDAPLIADPFMLLRLGEQHPAWRDGLVRQITQHRFARIVLLRAADPTDRWYETTDLGSPVVAAVARSYKLETVVPDYWRG
ncbi:MAG: glycosyltransferase family 39 protein, partial [Actinobacteria bacterium]|nr:glycosyltransferase family 39 protein [Actinomycetota bacterium]